jgi:hypothetical protein
LAGACIISMYFTAGSFVSPPLIGVHRVVERGRAGSTALRFGYPGARKTATRDASAFTGA